MSAFPASRRTRFCAFPPRGRRNTTYPFPTSANRAKPTARRAATSSSKPTYVEPGASATNDRRPPFQRDDRGRHGEAAGLHDVVIVHSFTRFFRDQFELDFDVRKLAKNGVRLISLTQDLGDDPMRVMMRQIMALFDEYQSKDKPNIRCERSRRMRARASGMARYRRSAIGSSPPSSAARRSRRN